MLVLKGHWIWFIESFIFWMWKLRPGVIQWIVQDLTYVHERKGRKELRKKQRLTEPFSYARCCARHKPFGGNQNKPWSCLYEDFLRKGRLSWDRRVCRSLSGDGDQQQDQGIIFHSEGFKCGRVLVVGCAEEGKLNGFKGLRKVQNKLKEADKRLKDAVYTVPSPKEDISTPLPQRIVLKSS